MNGHSRILIGNSRLVGDLCVSEKARGLIVFAHGRGSGRNSRRNLQVAQTLQRQGFATLLFDLLTEAEAADILQVFDIELLALRLQAVPASLPPAAQGLPMGLFGASTGAAAAFVAAARQPEIWSAVVSRGGRPDLAHSYLEHVRAASLLIVGAADSEVLALNRAAFKYLRCEKRIEVVPRASHLFEEAGTLHTAAMLASAWFNDHLAKPA
ncbi:dienelactone hydrolase family protein [Roseateles oligotrophus]|uniref:Alpha/beta hydrolase n=1 Tax=Roseateles oligotrophus TaxID=1769250 RepID=A0ABT2YMM9_9BURK|nr:alpha/beta hydrolase [Roseateles oligotrophus]